MELSDLRVFLAVARTQGITKAAQELHTVQSNVSARIHALEKELGAPLFRRHARGVALTNAGEQLLPYAERISRLVDDARHVIGDETDPCGPLRIGSMETTAGLRLPAVLAAFAEDCPRVEFSLITGPTEQLVRDVLEYRLDGALVSGPVRQPDMVETLVFEERLVLVTARRVSDLDAILRDPRILVFRSGCSYRRRLESILQARGAAGLRCMEFGTLDGILGCVGAGMGVTLLPAAVVERHVSLEQVRVHELPEEEARAQTVFVQRVDAPPLPALTRFLTHARAVEQTPPVLRMVGRSATATG
ncbi:LysR family transcriptional regulator [Streptomyces sp. NL15-2K]|uniref:LysR family transcriptional regulator n=1 Tax=Streptomyces sp. NL15-2K TaxID=376149 RepID=UPI000F572AC7|nr:MULTISPECIES: LysR family transcriptional regulator [Actinomycetes]WKX08612.1 LysR family transcriptional regulator [Kutzneria buriramensis]GCB53228.1 lysR family transcriptional regulator [Streptomyces sp. NL15-2K]